MAVAEGDVTITASAGGKDATCVITIVPGTLDKARRIMERVYEAWDAKNWNDPWIPGETWPGLEYYEDSDKVGLVLKSMGLRGEIPECVGDLGDLISDFRIQDAPDGFPHAYRQEPASGVLRKRREAHGPPAASFPDRPRAGQ